MNECFDKTPGITIAKFKAHMLGKLQASLSNFTAYDKAISEVLKSNSENGRLELCFTLVQE